MYNDLCNIRTFKVNHAERHEGSRKLKSHSAITLAVGRAEVLPDVSPWGAEGLLGLNQIQLCLPAATGVSLFLVTEVLN